MSKKIKLVKTKSAAWAGNGFGNESATWTIAGHEYIVIRNRGGVDWIAQDSRNGSFIVRPFGWTRAETVEIVVDFLEKQEAA